MKKLQQLCMAGVFTLMLTTATFAGDIQTPGITQPPPPPPDELSATIPGDIATGGIVMSDSAVDFALDLLQTMLLVF